MIPKRTLITKYKIDNMKNQYKTILDYTIIHNRKLQLQIKTIAHILIAGEILSNCCNASNLAFHSINVHIVNTYKHVYISN